MSFIKIIIVWRYFLTGCYTPKKPPKTAVEKIAFCLEPTPKWILMPVLCAGEQSGRSRVVCVIKWICPCASFSNFLQTSSSAGGESGDPGGCHACGVPGARPERPQPAVRVQHQNPPRASQWVNFTIAVNTLRSFLKDADFFFLMPSWRFCLPVLSMPDTVEEMCPEMPRLDRLLKDVNDVSESGARYSDMPQVWRADRVLFATELNQGWDPQFYTGG